MGEDAPKIGRGWAKKWESVSKKWEGVSKSGTGDEEWWKFLL